MASKRSKNSQKPVIPPWHSGLQIKEIDQANNLIATYVTSSDNGKGSRIDIIKPENGNSYLKSFMSAFLPVGYPKSVTSDYLEYQIYDSLQAFSSSIAGMLSSRAVLEGIGVGDSDASPTAALLLSVLQESMGRIATILFAHRLGTALEPECKMYRLAADIFNDAAMLLDCLSPALPKASRVLLLSQSSVLRALCGVAAGSSKASLSAHFATQGNLGELNAKDSSQETIISLMGMLAGSLVVSMISSKTATWTAMIFLLAIHLGMNYMAVRAVCLRTLNRQRANIVFSSVIESIHTIDTEDGKSWYELNPSRTLKALQSALYLSPGEVSLIERVFEWDGILRRIDGKVLGHCRIGVKFNDILEVLNANSSSSPTDLSELLEAFGELPYVIWYETSRSQFLVVLKTSNPDVHLMAWFHVLLFARYRGAKDASLIEGLKETGVFMNGYWRLIRGGLEEKGWGLGVDAMLTRESSCIQIGE